MSKWPGIRHQFRLDQQQAHFAAMIFASHPLEVTEGITKDGERLDVEGYPFFLANSGKRTRRTLEALAEYFGVAFGDAALTHGTALGLAQILGGVRVSPEQEILTSRNEHDAVGETLRFRAERDGTRYRTVQLYRDSRTVSQDEIVQNVASALRPSTRLLVLTWVYSSDGVKLPLAEIGRLVDRENQRRLRPEDQLLFVVDGVHGFGVEDVMFADLNCDFFIAGCHKWIFGPRGTAIIAGRHAAWRHVVPMVATLSAAPNLPAFPHIPGGVIAFENRWALATALDFHRKVLVKSDVQARVRELTARFKEGLAGIGGIDLVTPDSTELSSGVVCFDLDRHSPDQAVEHLRARGIVASVSAWDHHAGRNHVRFSVSILNSEHEVDTALAVLEQAC